MFAFALAWLCRLFGKDPLLMRSMTFSKSWNPLRNFNLRPSWCICIHIHIHQCLAQIWKFCEGRRNSGYWNVITPSTYRPGSSLLHTPALVLSHSLQFPLLTEYWNLTAEIEIYWNIVLSLQLSLSTWLQYLYLRLILRNSFSLKFWAQAEKKFYNLAKLEDLLFVLYILLR